jgi:hypothetical protein
VDETSTVAVLVIRPHGNAPPPSINLTFDRRQFREVYERINQSRMLFHR